MLIVSFPQLSELYVKVGLFGLGSSGKGPDGNR